MHRARRARWDFEEEKPAAGRARLRPRPRGRRRQPAHRRGHRLANVILTNGARLTWTTPIRSTAPRGHQPARRPSLGQRASGSWRGGGKRRQLPGAQPIHLYKNNTDNKGASYGTHENYLMKRETPSRTSCAT
ncbi:hypothetical protein GCM10023238_10290 [Streptomyces heliomycini]